MDREREDIARWLEEGRELLAMLNEWTNHLVEENQRLRAELGRLDELQAAIAGITQDNNRLRAERDELLAAFHRMAHLVEQVRHWRGGGAVG